MRFFLFIYYAELNLKIERFFIGAKLVIYMLSELLTDKTTLEEITTVMETVLKNKMSDFNDEYVELEPLNSIDDLRAFETRKNAKNIFGN